MCGFQAKIHRNKSLPFVGFVFMWNMCRRKLWSKRVFFSKRVVALSPSVVPKCQGILKQITFGITVHPRNFNIDTKHDGLEGAGIGCHDCVRIVAAMVWKIYLPSNMAILGIYVFFWGGGRDLKKT